LTRYSKGARGERELLNYLHDRGYSVMRGAGSGVNSLSPDIIAIKDGKGLAFECKAWDRESIAIENDRYDGLVEWRDNTGFSTFVAWRMNGAGWLFIKPDEMAKNSKSRSVTKKAAMQINRGLESILQL
jgi:Holliday junction resolvase